MVDSIKIPVHRSRVGFRAVTKQDDDFLYTLYATTRDDELTQTDWDDSQKEMFLKMQHDAQKQSYSAQYPNVEHKLIVLDATTPVGRIMLNRSDDEFRLVDISIVPEHRSKGIGTALISEFINEADGCGVPVRLHVFKYSRATTLYARLGFTQIEDAVTHHFMERLVTNEN